MTARRGAPLAAHASATITAGGKRLRPLLVVLAAEAAGGPELDGSSTARRSALTARRRRGRARPHRDARPRRRARRRAAAARAPHRVAAGAADAAVAAGDLLFARAFAELARNGDLAQLRALSDASSALAAGELLQREDAYAPHVALERYLRRCELKTARALRGGVPPGRLVAAERRGADSPSELADALGAFARRIGLAFQMLDDVLDVSGPSADRQDRGTDLLDGTVTLPLILARERDAAVGRLDLRRCAVPDRPRRSATGSPRPAPCGGPRARAGLVAEAKAALPASARRGQAAALERVADAVVERYT